MSQLSDYKKNLDSVELEDWETATEETETELTNGKGDDEDGQ